MSKIRHPEKLAWKVLEKTFPFFYDYIKFEDQDLVQDINQIGWLAYLDTDCKNSTRDFWNYCQREFYQLAKIVGFRRLRSNSWIKKELRESEIAEDYEDDFEKKIEIKIRTKRKK